MKRHYITIEVTVYAEDDEDAIRKSETLCKSIHQDFAYEPEVKEILEHRFHNIGSKETPSPLGKGRNCPRFLLLLVISIIYFLI